MSPTQFEYDHFQPMLYQVDQYPDFESTAMTHSSSQSSYSSFGSAIEPSDSSYGSSFAPSDRYYSSVSAPSYNSMLNPAYTMSETQSCPMYNQHDCISPTDTFIDNPVKTENDQCDYQTDDYYCASETKGTTSMLNAIPTASTPHSMSDQKMNKSSPSFVCVYAGCTSKGKFRRPTDLRRHMETQHHADEHMVDCTYKWCGRFGASGFTRKDHLREHLREVHREQIKKIHRRSTSGSVGGRG